MSTRFFAELPQDEFGNTAMPLAVIEAYVVMEPRPPLPDSPMLHVVAPFDHARCWPSHWLNGTWRWCEVEGPARELTRAEWARLVSDKIQATS